MMRGLEPLARVLRETVGVVGVETAGELIQHGAYRVGVVRASLPPVVQGRMPSAMGARGTTRPEDGCRASAEQQCGEPGYPTRSR